MPVIQYLIHRIILMQKQKLCDDNDRPNAIFFFLKYQQLKDELDDCLREISAYDSFYVPKAAPLICQNLQNGLILKITKYAIVFDVYTLILRKFVIIILEIIARIIECSLVYAWQVLLGSLRMKMLVVIVVLLVS